MRLSVSARNVSAYSTRAISQASFPVYNPFDEAYDKAYDKGKKTLLTIVVSMPLRASVRLGDRRTPRRAAMRPPSYPTGLLACMTSGFLSIFRRVKWTCMAMELPACSPSLKRAAAEGVR